MCIAATLQSIKVVIVTRAFTSGNTFCQRFNVFELTVLIINPLAPVAHHFLIENLKHIFKTHCATKFFSDLTKFVRTTTNKVPQYRVMAGKSITANTLIHCIPGCSIVVFKD